MPLEGPDYRHEEARRLLVNRHKREQQDLEARHQAEREALADQISQLPEPADAHVTAIHLLHVAQRFADKLTPDERASIDAIRHALHQIHDGKR
jgi:hypothetical protein